MLSKSKPIFSRLEKKIITIEKPTFLRMKDFDDAEDMIQRSSNKVYPIFQHRYTLPKLNVGKVYHAQVRVNWCRPQRYYDQADWRGTWEHDGGVLTNQGVHAIDIVRYLLGDIKDVNFEMHTAGVDIETRRMMWEFLRELNASGTTIILTTHYLEEAEALCDQFAIINKGDVITARTKAELMAVSYTHLTLPTKRIV